MCFACNPSNFIMRDASCPTRTQFSFRTKSQQKWILIRASASVEISKARIKCGNKFDLVLTNFVTPAKDNGVGISEQLLTCFYPISTFPLFLISLPSRLQLLALLLRLLQLRLGSFKRWRRHSLGTFSISTTTTRTLLTSDIQAFNAFNWQLVANILFPVSFFLLLQAIRKSHVHKLGNAKLGK